MNFNIQTFGDITIKKVDKETEEVVSNTQFNVEFSGKEATYSLPRISDKRYPY